MQRSFKLVVVLISMSLILAACASPTTAPTTAPATDVPQATEAGKPTEVAPQATEAAPVEPADPFMVNPADFSGTINIAGSSTVYPLSERIVEMFKADGYEGQGDIALASIGSGAGFERFCKNGETDISNASRAIKDSEIESCKAIGRDPIELRVGTDAIAIVVNKSNTFVTDLTTEQLAKVFSDQATKWSDIDPTWPAEDIKRYVPGTDSGTFDFFVEVVSDPVFGETGKETFLKSNNLQPSEDDNVLVTGIEGDPYAIGFFGFAYYSENASKLNVVSVDGVTPDFDTAESGDYSLSRPLYIYTSANILKEKPQVAAFVAYFLTNTSDVISEVGYFPASEDAIMKAEEAYLAAVK